MADLVILELEPANAVVKQTPPSLQPTRGWVGWREFPNVPAFFSWKRGLVTTAMPSEPVAEAVSSSVHVHGRTHACSNRSPFIDNVICEICFNSNSVPAWWFVVCHKRPLYFSSSVPQKWEWMEKSCFHFRKPVRLQCGHFSSSFRRLPGNLAAALNRDVFKLPECIASSGVGRFWLLGVWLFPLIVIDLIDWNVSYF